MATSRKTPRVVVVTRPTQYDELLARHATRQQAAFFLDGRGQSLESIDRAHQLWLAAVNAVSQAIPVSWRRTSVSRPDLNRFVFEPSDLIVAVGQDGLVANVAKYLTEQNVVGINPDPVNYDGILVPHAPSAITKLFRAIGQERHEIESRCMVSVSVDDGQRLLALNELFLGHRTHQSARYHIGWEGTEEVQSSSGLIVATGTGATGWARSICIQRPEPPPLPGPTEPRLAFFARETFPSVGTGTSIQDGVIVENQRLTVVSQMNEGGVIFGDGIEDDRIDFHWGMTAAIEVADLRLHLVRV
jgi:NAD kinase